MINVQEEDVWKDYIKAHPKAKSMRYKPWPLFSDWVEIFGKDRATGEGAVGFTDARNVEVEDKIIGLLSSVCQEMNNRLSELSTRVGQQVDEKAQRIAVYNALKKIPNLTTVARYLSKNVDEMELFFSLDDDGRSSMVYQILSGSS
ncbi:Unknown protein [Striga hermonthica]|uniref:Uncharacterized protein n=1 Tax=Striga hermonthica TaxID=68872 RepID=A0A9N7NIC9_STRHE|nr:Unknown protein [Striga hermonthica]